MTPSECTYRKTVTCLLSDSSDVVRSREHKSHKRSKRYRFVKLFSGGGELSSIQRGGARSLVRSMAVLKYRSLSLRKTTGEESFTNTYLVSAYQADICREVSQRNRVQRPASGLRGHLRQNRCVTLCKLAQPVLRSSGRGQVIALSMPVSAITERHSGHSPWRIDKHHWIFLPRSYVVTHPLLPGGV